MSEALAVRAPAARLRDVLELTKPRIGVMVVFTTAMGMWLAPGPIGSARAAAVIVFTALLVASANALNSFLERDLDGRMHRTQGRPLPAGRLDPWAALALGLVTAAFAVPALVLVANPLTAALGLLAWVTYVLVYTPLKKATPLALEVGAIPGALPPLMGWTAVTGSLDPGGLGLFALLFFWQLPHFLAISLYLKDDYARGGVRVLPLVRGDAVASHRLLAYTLLLVASSLALAPLGGTLYAITATILGMGFLAFAARGISPGAGPRVARGTFLYSLVYLTAVLAVLLADAR